MTRSALRNPTFRITWLNRRVVWNCAAARRDVGLPVDIGAVPATGRTDPDGVASSLRSAVRLPNGAA
jgi:hypothetical protein